MLWKECSVMDERLRFVARILEGEPMTDLLRQADLRKKPLQSASNARPRGIDRYTANSGNQCAVPRFA